MVRRDLSRHDASEHAASELEYVIKKRTNDDEVKYVSTEKAKTEQRLYQTKSTRNVTRVLFVSRDTNLLNPTNQTLDGYIDISTLFDEVHILILREGIKSTKPVLRVSENVWIYTASSKYWWKTPMEGFDLAEGQLEFANGFRPDLIVARDPFESALVASRLAKKYDKPSQLHILEDYSTAAFVQKNSHNFWRLFLPFFTVPRFKSVRTLTGGMLSRIQKNFTITDVATLPRYQNYLSIVQKEEAIDLKEKYKPFIFFMLYVGTLGHDSTLHLVMNAAQKFLHNPRVGLIVLGDGPARSEFVKRAKALGIEKQVIFETRVHNSASYLKSANILLVSDTDFDSEELVLKAAAAGIPTVMSRTDKREDIFVHGESAFLCEATDTESFAGRINDLMNNIELRNEFSDNSQEITRTKFHHDSIEYRIAYRTSIEQAFFVDDDEL